MRGTLFAVGFLGVAALAGLAQAAEPPDSLKAGWCKRNAERCATLPADCSRDCRDRDLGLSGQCRAIRDLNVVGACAQDKARCKDWCRIRTR